MKKLFFLASFLYSLSAIAQEKLDDILPLKENVVTYSEVIELRNVSKVDIYKKAKKWFVHFYKSANDVIQLDDADKGELTGKAVFNIDYYQRNPTISHTMTIMVKENKYKYVLTDFYYSDKQNSKFSIEQFPKGWAGKKKLYTTIDQSANSAISSLKKAMSSTSEDDW